MTQCRVKQEGPLIYIQEMKKFIFALATMFLSIAPAIAQETTTEPETTTPDQVEESTDIPDNIMYFSGAEVKPGERATLSVKMKNSVPMLTVSGFFTLPEGMVVPQEDDFYLIDLSLERTTARKHNILSNCVDGEYRVGVIHSANKPFAGTEGEVFTVTVDVAETVAPGEYEIKFYNQELVDEKNVIVTKKGEYTSKITVVDPTSVGAAEAADNNAKVEIYNANGVKLPTLQPGLNILRNVSTGKTSKVTVK